MTGLGLNRAYTAVALADTALAARNGDRPSRLRWLTKSALMPLLVAKLEQESRAGADRDTTALRDRTRAGLALSWAGDVALLGRGDSAFATGLGCFAAAQGSYGAAFATVQRSTPPAAAAPMTAVGLGLGGMLARRAGRLCVPVAGYSALITAMAVRALGVDAERVGRAAATRIATGAGLFVVSDGLIGLRRFRLSDAAPHGVRAAIDAAVMATYATGQWLIADGVSRAGR